MHKILNYQTTVYVKVQMDLLTSVSVCCLDSLPDLDLTGTAWHVVCEQELAFELVAIDLLMGCFSLPEACLLPSTCQARDHDCDDFS